LRRNQSITFLAALELAVDLGAPWACCDVKASTVTIEGEDWPLSVGWGWIPPESMTSGGEVLPLVAAAEEAGIISRVESGPGVAGVAGVDGVPECLEEPGLP
jgi:hypothetical protein